CLKTQPATGETYPKSDLFNKATLYMQEALSWMRSNGEETGGEDIARLSPLMHGHINMLGHYTFTLPEDILKGELRALNFNLNNELPS
ncbi:Tn3 family transposase, partial [Klebsiella pneumoniae]